jgi:hypothetical protein
MNTLFAILFILALLLLVVSVIKPGVNKKTGKPFKRKDMAIGFGILALAFAILTGITAPHKAATTTHQASATGYASSFIYTTCATDNNGIWCNPK